MNQIKITRNKCLRSVRPRLQRSFLTWLKENRERFLIPVHFLRRTDQCIDLSLVGISKVISAYLSRRELDVLATQDDKVFDRLVDIDVCHPVRCAQGYVCTCQPEEDRDVFPTREALWREHVFDVFLAWVNEKLVPARIIRLDSVRGGRMTGATLMYTGEDRYRAGEWPLLGKLSSLEGQRMIEPGNDRISCWIYPIDGSELVERFEAVVNAND